MKAGSRARRLAGVTAATLAMGVSVALAGGGFQGANGVGDPFFPKAGNTGYQVDRYGLRVAYKPRTDKLTARANIEARADTSGPPLARFNLDFRGPRITRLEVDGSPAAFDRQGQELIVTPDVPIPHDTQFGVEVRYEGRPSQVTNPDGSKEGWTKTSDGAVALGEPQGSPSWFPANDHPTDKALFRIRLTTPRGTIGISNGRLIERRRTERRVTTIWEQGEPMATYLALVAIGKFRLDRGTLGGHEYLAAVDRRFARGKLRALRARTKKAHAFMAGVAGPYPFTATGGMVDPSNVGYALETQTRTYYPGPPSLDLVVHEVAHQWYGNSVSLETWDQIWLNEGFATYMEWLYAERHGGPATQQRFNQLYSTHGAGDNAFWNPPPAAVPGPEQLFDGTVYQRGAMALEVLRQAIGDSDFFTLLEDWATDNAEGNVNTEDLYDAIEAISGDPVPALFFDWLLDPGKPDAPGP